MKRTSSLFILVFVLLTQTTWTQKEITLEDLWQNYSYFTKSVPGFNFMNDGKHYTRLERNNITKYDLVTGKLTDTLLAGEKLKGSEEFDGTISSYAFSSDEKFVLLKSNSESIYRRSSKAYFFVYDFAREKLYDVSKGKKVMYATLSPDARSAAYVYENNLFLLDLASGKEEQITHDGEKNKIINGAADWVYEEEFSIAQAFSWSPDGQHIAYLRFDETNVPAFTMTLFKDEMYPEYETFKYPKVGEKNADVSAHVYQLSTKKSVQLDMGDMEEMYIPRIRWTEGASELVVFKMNRHQNHLQLHLFDFVKNENRLLFEEKNKYYIDITDDLTFLKDKKHFIWTSESEGYNQIYLYGMDGSLKHKITQGNYDVRSFYGVDEKRKLVYYSSAETSPLESQVYVIGLDGSGKKQITREAGYHSCQFSSTYDYYVDNFSSTTTPPVYSVFDRKQNLVRVIEDNADFKNHTETYGLNPVEFFSFKTSENVELNGYMIKPPNFNERRRYPVFMTQYSGPGSQSVTNRWGGTNYWWYQMLAQKGYIVVCVDPRGTGARGEEFKKMTYLQLGKYETIDQIEAAKYLGGLPYVDASRIGIFGWSYGGYMSSLCLFKGADVFSAAIAVAPVTNWKWYDTIYTERYMRTYKENEAGYRDNSPIYFADSLKGDYLLIHGLADDNVHWQNAAEMSASLIKANKQYDTYVYPNRNHGIYGDNARIHLYTKMTNFLDEKLMNKKVGQWQHPRP